MVNNLKFGTIEVKKIHVTQPRTWWQETEPIISTFINVSGKDRKEYKNFLQDKKHQRISDTLILRTDFPEKGVLQISNGKGRFRFPKNLQEVFKLNELIKKLDIPKSTIKDTPFKSSDDFKNAFSKYLLKIASQTQNN